MDHRPLYIGYHGCERSLAERLILNREPMKKSTNNYDWLGPGYYFWENDPLRALEFASDTKHCADPFVVGAVLDLGHCLDLTCREGLVTLSNTWKNIVSPSLKEGTTLANKAAKKGENGELMLRFLDCHVIRALHMFNDDNNIQPYDSVRGAFWEGEYIYPTAGFMEKTHIQICICNPKCIIGLFLPEGYSL